jgi:hypothetical protein
MTGQGGKNSNLKFYTYDKDQYQTLIRQGNY